MIYLIVTRQRKLRFTITSQPLVFDYRFVCIFSFTLTREEYALEKFAQVFRKHSCINLWNARGTSNIYFTPLRTETSFVFARGKLLAASEHSRCIYCCNIRRIAANRSNYPEAPLLTSAPRRPAASEDRWGSFVLKSTIMEGGIDRRGGGRGGHASRDASVPVSRVERGAVILWSLTHGECGATSDGGGPSGPVGDRMTAIAAVYPPGFSRLNAESKSASGLCVRYRDLVPYRWGDTPEDDASAGSLGRFYGINNKEGPRVKGTLSPGVLILAIEIDVRRSSTTSQNCIAIH